MKLYPFIIIFMFCCYFPRLVSVKKTYLVLRILLYLQKVQESCIFEHLRVMIIDEMIYLVHARGLAEHVQSSLNSESPLLFVDIEQDPPKVFLCVVVFLLMTINILLFPLL